MLRVVAMKHRQGKTVSMKLIPKTDCEVLSICSTFDKLIFEFYPAL